MKKTLAEEIREQVAALNSSKSDLMNSRAALVAERNDILDAPLAKADIKAFIHRYIDAQAAQYPLLSGLDRTFNSFAYPRGESRLSPNIGDGRRRTAPPFALRDVDKVFGDTSLLNGSNAVFGQYLDLVMDSEGIMRNTGNGLCFFFGEAIKEKLGEWFDAHFAGFEKTDESRIGPPIAERRKRLAEIDKAISALDVQIGNVTAQLSELRTSAQPAREAEALAPSSTRAAAVQSDPRPRKPYDEGDVLKMTGFNLKQLREANQDGGFPKPQFASGSNVPKYVAADVDAWMRVNMPKKAFS